MAWRVEVLTSVSAPKARSITTPKSPVPCRVGGVVAGGVLLAVLAQPAAKSEQTPIWMQGTCRQCLQGIKMLARLSWPHSAQQADCHHQAAQLQVAIFTRQTPEMTLKILTAHLLERGA